MNNRSICNTTYWIVVVDVSTHILEAAQKLPTWCIVIVARDQQKNIEYPANMFYLTLEIQNELARKSTFFRTTLFSSRHSYAGLKNAGYLWAIIHGAKTIWDFDPQNKLIIKENILLYPSLNGTVEALTVPNYNSTFLNPYEFFMNETNAFRPRGFPTQLMENSYIESNQTQTLSGVWPIKNIGIIHSLANGHADIDPVYRSITTSNSWLDFKKLSKEANKDTKLIVPRRIFSVYNEQSTLHLQQSLWALLLPINLDHRVSDIWRSYVMQRLMWDIGLQIAFAGPYVVRQERHHEEFHWKSDRLVNFLKNWSSNTNIFVDRIQELYIDLYKHGFVDIDDVHLFQLWLQELNQYGYIFPTIAPKLTLAVRTFSGHLGRMNHWLIPTVNMFVDRNIIDFLLILDDESKEDHKLGDCLKQHNFSVKYESPPAFSKTKVILRGYDRQQWSTFYMDQFSDSDYIGVVDADAMIYSFMHPYYSIFASNTDARIMLKPMAGDHYIYDKVALRFDLNLDFMWPNRMPMWYRWETFQNLRNYISFAWNGSSFDDAFIEFSKNQGYSQFTILSSYAIRFESSYYRVIMNDDPQGAISVAANHGQANRAREMDIRIGCCRTFDIGCNHTSTPRMNNDHLLRFDYTEFLAVNATEKTNAYYEHVNAYLKQMLPLMVTHMKKSCQLYLNNKVTPICV